MHVIVCSWARRFADTPGEMYDLVKDIRSIALTSSAGVDRDELEDKLEHLSAIWCALESSILSLLLSLSFPASLCCTRAHTKGGVSHSQDISAHAPRQAADLDANMKLLQEHAVRTCHV